MRFSIGLKERISVWRAIFARPWVYAFVAIYGVVGFLDSPVPTFVIARLLPVKYHYLWDRLYVMPDFSLQTWIMLWLAASVVILLEGSYRAIRTLRSELSEARDKVDARVSFREKKAQLGDIIQNINACIEEFIAARASDETRSALVAVQHDAYKWLAENLGHAEAQAFFAAPASSDLPGNFSWPLKNGGTYQKACGRLSFLVSLVKTLSSN